MPVHPNPNVNKIVESKLGKLSNVILAPPLNYRSFIWLMNKSAVIVTDSGGIQEEAISLSKFVVVTREETERQELIDSGWGFLVGTDINKIVNKTNYFLSIDNQNIPDKTNPFGDGTASSQIIEIIKNTITSHKAKVVM